MPCMYFLLLFFSSYCIIHTFHIAYLILLYCFLILHQPVICVGQHHFCCLVPRCLLLQPLFSEKCSRCLSFQEFAKASKHPERVVIVLGMINPNE